MIAQCLLVAAVATVVTSVSVSQEEYARYISQQQLQRLQEDKQPEKNGQPIRRPVLVQIVPSDARQASYRPQPAAYQPQPAAYQPQPAAYQPQPASYQPQVYLQQPEDYQQPEQQQYQPPVRVQAPRPKAPPRPKALNRPDKPEDEENDNNPNAQYQFSFDISDDESTNYHNRKEQRDGEKISGSYSVVDSDGFIRTVTYTADPEEGFKAEVSREPTNIQVKIPTPAPQTAPGPQYRLQAERKPQPQYIAVQASEPESAAQSAEPISGYYRPVPQQIKALAPVHRFAVPPPSRSQQQAAGSKAAGDYAPTGSPLLYQAYQQQ